MLQKVLIVLWLAASVHNVSIICYRCVLQNSIYGEVRVQDYTYIAVTLTGVHEMHG